MRGQSDVAIQPEVAKPANAYQAYQLARYHFHKISLPDMLKSRVWLDEAVRMDDQFAPAYVALAEQTIMEAITGLHAPADSFPKARAALSRASDLKLESAEFYAVAGFASLICDWNFSEAEAKLKRALELNPHHTFAHKYLGETLMFQGRSAEAETYLQRALKIEPMSLHVGIILTLRHFLARDYEKLIEECERILALHPRFVMAATYRCLAWEQLGRATDAVAEYERILREPDGEIGRRFMGYGYALCGDHEKAMQTIVKLEDESRQHYLSPTHQANIYAALGDDAQALSNLDKALSEHDPWILWIGTDPRLDSLRSNSRFNEILIQVGLGHLVHKTSSAKRAAVMPADLWPQIDRLFHEALARSPTDRAEFLASQCAGDENLRREVESLISSLEEAGDFIETPAGDVAAELLGTHESTFQPGQTLEHYRIVSQIGSGGMGEVYLSEDTRLNRKVALKLLPPHFTVNPDRVRRFEREARAASALNHPNIVTIYEIGKSNSAHFIATEFVDGKTLRQLINEKPFTLKEALNVSLQVADALSGAHAAGIVHRDIKPENIMIRRDGYVKVLDFGLAKLTEQQAASEDETETPTLLQSNPGLVMGTVQYMSPEQARGKRVDARTDIWSLGIVLYELLAGHVPFNGETPSHVMVSLMEDKLPPLKQHATVPEELDQFVTKALRKNQKERYQTAGQLARSLKDLKQKLQRDSELNEWLKTVPTKKDGMNLPPLTLLAAVSGAHRVPLEDRPAAETNSVESHPTSSGEYVAGEIKINKKVVIAVAAVLIASVVTIGIGGLIAFRYGSKPESTKPSARPSNMKIARLTTNGKTSTAAISPDGKTVAYVMREGALLSLWIRQVGTTNNIQIVPPANMGIGQETFSPDGNYIYYQARDKQNPEGILWQVPTFGGVPRKITSHINSPIAFSPDGSRFAFIRNDVAGAGENQLMIANADGSNEKKLAVRKGDTFFSVSGLSWSPDGKLLGCPAGSYAGGFHFAVVTVDVATGEQKEITDKRFTDIGRASWLSDGSGMLVSATEPGVTQNQIWLIPYPSGEAQPVTHDLTNYYGGTSLTADSRSLVTVGYDVTANVWMAPANDLMRGKQITSGKLEGTGGLAWTPDGRIVYSSIAGGNFDLWIMNADGTNQKQLISDEATEYEPYVSPDGRYIVFSSSRGKLPGVWRMDIDGSNLKQLTEGDDYVLAITPDGKSVLFTSWRTNKMSPWRVSIDGGEPVQISNLFIIGAAIAPDGKSLVCLHQDENPSQPHHLIVMPIEGGAPTKSFDLLPTTTAGTPEFAPNGKSVTVYDSRTGTQNLWSFPLDGSPMKQLTDFKPDGLFMRQLSFDRKWMAMSRGVTTSDVILITDFR